MNTTDNYQLNQWEGTDRILRTDFNKDNLKTDDAVAELRAELAAAIEAVRVQVEPTLLLESTVTEAARYAFVDMSGIQWDQWREVYVEAELTADCTTSRYTATIYANTTSNSFAYARCARLADSPEHGVFNRLTLFVNGNPESYVSGLYMGGEAGVGYAKISYQSLTKLGYYLDTDIDYPIQPGSRFRVLGVK